MIAFFLNGNGDSHDRLLFQSEASAEIFAEEYLAAHGSDPLAARAATIFSLVRGWDYQGLPRYAVRCFDCGADNLEHWYTSTRGGYHLCPACFEARVAKGRAKMRVEGDAER
ncbi:hypothetical protein [Nitrospira calida]|jgi:hypothetical protein